MCDRENRCVCKQRSTTTWPQSVYPLMLSAMLMTGCAGTSSQFECNSSSSDACITIEQANERARAETESGGVKPAASALPHLVDPGLQGRRDWRVAENTAAVTQFFLPPITTTSKHNMIERNVQAFKVASKPSNHCGQTLCEKAAEMQPVRTPPVTVNMWIAPYVDTDDVMHQPGRVSFVVTQSAWSLPIKHF